MEKIRGITVEACMRAIIYLRPRSRGSLPAAGAAVVVVVVGSVRSSAVMESISSLSSSSLKLQLFWRIFMKMLCGLLDFFSVFSPYHYISNEWWVNNLLYIYYHSLAPHTVFNILGKQGLVVVVVMVRSSSVISSISSSSSSNL